jgi:hypothetical protein
LPDHPESGEWLSVKMTQKASIASKPERRGMVLMA